MKHIEDYFEKKVEVNLRVFENNEACDALVKLIRRIVKEELEKSYQDKLADLVSTQTINYPNIDDEIESRKFGFIK